MRDLLRGLRCNGWLGRFPSSYGLPSLLYHLVPGALLLSLARLLLLLLELRFTRCCRFTCRGCPPYLCLSLYGFSSCRSAFAATALSARSHSKQAEPPPAGGRAFTRRRHGSLPVALPHRYLIARRSSMHFEQSCLTAKFSGAANGAPMLTRDLLRGLRCNAGLGS